MSWIDKIIQRLPRSKKARWAQSLNGYTPIFSQFGTNIYASDVVQQALKCIVDEIKKLNPMHVRIKNYDPVPVNDNIQKVLNNPNRLMTTSEFLERTMWLLILNYNVFILPTYYEYTDHDGNLQEQIDELFPLKPTSVGFIECPDKLYVNMKFENNYETTLPYDRLIHIRLNYAMNEYMGGNKEGNPDYEGLLQTLQLNQKLLEGIANAMNASYSINGVVKFNTMLDDGKTEVALKEMERKLKNSESGFLPLDLKSEFTPLNRKVQLVDNDTLKFIDEKILRNFGVPLAILTGDYTKQQYEAFYQKTLEPLIIQISQAFTKKLFTDRERSFGNEIKLYPKDLIFLTTEQTIEMVTLLGNTGALYENEKRTAFGLLPLPELEGKRYMSLNYVDVNIANQYQIGQKDDGGKKDEEE